MTDQLLSLPDAAAVLGVPERTLYNWRYRGEGPLSFRVGRRVRYRKEELDRWLREQEKLTGRGDAA